MFIVNAFCLEYLRIVLKGFGFELIFVFLIFEKNASGPMCDLHTVPLEFTCNSVFSFFCFQVLVWQLVIICKSLVLNLEHRYWLKAQPWFCHWKHAYRIVPFLLPFLVSVASLLHFLVFIRHSFPRFPNWQTMGRAFPLNYGLWSHFVLWFKTNRGLPLWTS